MNRQLENLIKVGTVAEVDPQTNRLRVSHGGLQTDWLPYLVPAAGGVSVWRLPSVGKMCVVLSPSGETENGIVLLGMASSQYPAPSNSPDETVMQFPDGARLAYNHQSGALTATGVKTANLSAATSVTIDTPQTNMTGALTVAGLLTYQGGMSGGGGSGTTITGSLNHTGSFTNTGTMSSNGVVLHSHTHPDLTSGGNTGEPNP
ncbi:phage baseplate assembly protein V [Neisseria brasiliensis]|uniref:phage baseplate assembly protein V n=1 Tax=Neisseria TaxID=482 RepID=UPI000C2811D8|nr:MULTISPECIES: phage baseplate assembly protein V [Neisseria]PJO78742.1 phage baseplate assembly protein V [Neisseria sp. N177_16]QGL24212.1 phage baseplate assembly protein V [Neisseria brasiliensis]